MENYSFTFSRTKPSHIISTRVIFLDKYLNIFLIFLQNNIFFSRVDGKNFLYRWHNAISWSTVVLPKWFEIAEEMGCEWNSLFQNIRSLVGKIWHSNSRNLAHFRKDLWYYITKISWIFHIESFKDYNYFWENICLFQVKKMLQNGM